MSGTNASSPGFHWKPLIWQILWFRGSDHANDITYNMAPCCLAEIYIRFWVTCYPHLLSTCPPTDRTASYSRRLIVLYKPFIHLCINLTVRDCWLWKPSKQNVTESLADSIVKRRSWVNILVQRQETLTQFLWFSSFLQVNCGVVCQIKSQNIDPHFLTYFNLTLYIIRLQHESLNVPKISR